MRVLRIFAANRGSRFHPTAEVAAAPGGEGAFFFPGAEGRDGEEGGGEEVDEFAGGEGGFPGGRMRGERRERAHRRRGGGGEGGLFAFSFFAEAEQEVGDGDVDGADLVAGAAEGGGFGEVGEFGKFFSGEKRR